MPKKLHKILLLPALIIILVISAYFFSGKENNLEVDFFDVGQGDSALIQAPGGQNILIDGGPDKKVLKGLGENLGWRDRKIDLMILTHPHDDHVSGLNEVIKRYDVEQIVYTGVLHSAPGFLEWLRAFQKNEIPIKIAYKGFKIDLEDGVSMEVLSPTENMLGKEVKNLNNTSLVIKLRYKDKTFLFIGDAEEEIEQKLLEENIKADVLKIGHHGSDTGSTEAFLKAVDPEIAVISVGKNNQFGHPDKIVLKRLEKLNIKVF
ncbi:MAG: MBL fold metallo-hydrolase, partial [Patescibacteria group bacterium]